MIDNYHLTRKNASYHLVIWRGHLWGGRFQMAILTTDYFLSLSPLPRISKLHLHSYFQNLGRRDI